MSSWIHHNLGGVVVGMGWMMFSIARYFEGRTKKLEREIIELQDALQRRFGSSWRSD